MHQNSDQCGTKSMLCRSSHPHCGGKIKSKLISKRAQIKGSSVEDTGTWISIMSLVEEMRGRSELLCVCGKVGR